MVALARFGKQAGSLLRKMFLALTNGVMRLAKFLGNQVVYGII